MLVNKSLEDVARQIRLLVLDVDGVMTDGGLYYDASGLVMKRFDVHDGIGIKMAQASGIEIAVLSGMDVPCVVKRLEILGIKEYVGGFANKATHLDAIRTRLGIAWEEMAYLGDDWIDLAPMRRVALPVAVANAVPEVKAIARMVTEHSGGHGAIRELVTWILRCQGKYEDLLTHWTNLE